MLRRNTVLFCTALLLVFAAPLCHAAEQLEIEELVARCGPAYVFVGGGSGAIISPDGYVITNAHVVQGSKRWKLRTPDGSYHLAQVVGTCPGTDLCLLKIDVAENLPHLPLGNSDELDVGDLVIAIGNPFALGRIDGKPTFTLGVVSALHVDRPHAYDAIQTDTPINPGNSGGPLINLKGELIGVNAQIQTRFGLRQNTGVGYAVSSNQVQRFLPALKAAEGRPLESGRINGIVLETSPDKQDEAAVVRQVREGSPAAEAGVRVGDIVRAIGGAAIETVQDYQRALGRYPIGTEVALKVERKETKDGPSTQHTFKMTIEKHGPAYVGFKFDVKSSSSLAVAVVDPDSPAARAGMKAGDLIAGFVVAEQAMPLRSRRDYYSLFGRMRPGMTVPLVVRRGNQNVVLNIVVEERD